MCPTNTRTNSKLVRLVLAGCILPTFLANDHTSAVQASEVKPEKGSGAETSGTRLLTVPPLVRDGLKRSKDEMWARGNQALNAGRLSEAIAKFREIVAIDSLDPKARTDLGVALAQAGDRKGAI